MSEYFTNFLVALTTFLAAIVCVVGLFSVFSQEAKAETTSIDKRMEQLEKLYDELYTFHQSSGFHKWGYGTMGRGDWADKVKEISKDQRLKSYMESLVPEKLETEFLFLKSLEPKHLWFLGRHYMNAKGHENKGTLTVKSQFNALFKLHKSRKK